MWVGVGLPAVACWGGLDGDWKGVSGEGNGYGDPSPAYFVA